ncbi:BT_3987 domain-containing protein [Chitinophaga lutea]
MKKKILYTLCFAAALSACDKELVKEPGQYSRLYMPQATEYPAVRSFVMRDTLQPLLFGAAFGGVEEQHASIKVRFAEDKALVDTFNKKNNTAYLPMPAGSYTVEGLEATIRNGALSSDALKVKVKTAGPGGLAEKVQYLLPLTIVEATPDIVINEKLRTAYFLVSAAYEEYDRSSWKVVSVSSFESPNGGEKAWDKDVVSTWHTQWKAAKPAHPHVLTVNMDTTVMVHGFYTLPANIATGNPQDIKLELSTDGVTWTNAGNYSFVNTYVKQYVYLAEPKMARYYRLTVLSSFANTHFTHLAEWGAF